jgi:hypothetical protein
MIRTRRPLAGLVAIAVAAMISACGSSATGSAGGNSSTTDHLTALKFAECMRANGVSGFPDPSASGTLTLDGVVNGTSLNLSAPASKRALVACKRLEPPGFTGTKRSASQQQAALKFAECMRENGVPDFPDPTPNGPLIDTNRIPSAAGRGAHSIPGLSAAAKKCTAIYSGELGLRGQ